MSCSGHVTLRTMQVSSSLVFLSGCRDGDWGWDLLDTSLVLRTDGCTTSLVRLGEEPLCEKKDEFRNFSAFVIIYIFLIHGMLVILAFNF